MEASVVLSAIAAATGVIVVMRPIAQTWWRHWWGWFDMSFSKQAYDITFEQTRETRRQLKLQGEGTYTRLLRIGPSMEVRFEWFDLRLVERHVNWRWHPKFVSRYWTTTPQSTINIKRLRLPQSDPVRDLFGDMQPGPLHTPIVVREDEGGGLSCTLPEPFLVTKGSFLYILVGIETTGTWEGYLSFRSHIKGRRAAVHKKVKVAASTSQSDVESKDP